MGDPGVDAPGSDWSDFDARPALTEIATNGLPGRNVYFEDSGESGALSFDYKLRQGVLSRSNALNIAHLLGIDTAATESD